VGIAVTLMAGAVMAMALARIISFRMFFSSKRATASCLIRGMVEG
jgi:hypothetical protein